MNAQSTTLLAVIFLLSACGAPPRSEIGADQGVATQQARLELDPAIAGCTGACQFLLETELTLVRPEDYDTIHGLTGDPVQGLALHFDEVGFFDALTGERVQLVPGFQVHLRLLGAANPLAFEVALSAGEDADDLAMERARAGLRELVGARKAVRMLVGIELQLPEGAVVPAGLTAGFRLQPTFVVGPDPVDLSIDVGGCFMSMCG